MMRKALFLIVLAVFLSSCASSENSNNARIDINPLEKKSDSGAAVPQLLTPTITASQTVPGPAGMAQGGQAKDSSEFFSANYVKFPNDVIVLTETDIASIPDDAIRIMSTFSGASGGGWDPCISNEPTDGYASPILFPMLSRIDRLDEVNVITCGWPEGEEVSVQIILPSGELIKDSYTPWNKEVSVYYDFQLTDQLGVYQFVFEGNSGKVEHTVELLLPEKPTAYVMDYGSGPLVLVGFSSKENIDISFYQLDSSGFDTIAKIAGYSSLTCNDVGQLLIDFHFEQRDYVYVIEGENAGMINPHEGGANKGFEDFPFGQDSCIFNSEFIKDVTIPDGTILKQNENFTKTWRLRNNGTCDWNSNDEIFLQFYTGHSLGVFKRIKLPAEIFPVRAGETVDISVEFTAPNYAGKFRSQWQLFSTSKYGFGKKPYVDIVVP